MKVIIQGQTFEVTKDKGLICPNGKTFTSEQMREAQKEYKGANRIHKPMALLFWSDVVNGQSKNWNLIKE